MLDKVKTLSGILIDPVTKKVSFETFKYESYQDIYTIIDADCFDVVTLTHTEEGASLIMFIDDEGLFKEDQSFFKLFIDGLSHTPFAGKCFVVMSDREGETVSLLTDISYIFRICVKWLGSSEGLEHAINKGQVQRPYSAFGTFDPKDGLNKPSEMTKTWEWHPPSSDKKGA